MTRPGAPSDGDAVLLRVGRRAWALLGLAGVVVVGYLLLREVSIVATPLVVALFPAAVLWPVAAWLKARGWPGTAASLLLLVAVSGLVGLALWFIVPTFADQLPAVGDELEQALADLEDLIADAPFSLPFDIGSGGLGEWAEEIVGLGGAGGDALDQGLDIARRITEFATASALFLVALFFYLRDGDRIWAGITSLLPARPRHHVRRVSGQLAWTLGAYFRGQMIIALVDAVAIGIGLALLGVPLVLPLALLVFLGGFFPIVGAFVSGLVAVLVALADQGLTTALLALLVVVAVQQTEGNLLEPLILSPVLKLHPFLIIVVVTVGAVGYGVLGAFLAVPLSACAARVIDYARGRPPAAGPGSHPDDGDPPWREPAPGDGPAPAPNGVPAERAGDAAS